MKNETWSEKIIQKTDSSFKHRWVVYKNYLEKLLDKNSVWIDCGCGNNEMIESYKHLSRYAVGMDVTDNNVADNFLKADIKHLPFSSNSVNLITLRFVVEHFEKNYDYMNEINRTLEPGGRVLILTTNLLSPFIFIPKVMLSNKIKMKILSYLFKVKDEDIFPAYHKLNTPRSFYKLRNYKVKDIIFISDLNYTRKSVFLILLLWHSITKISWLQRFRTNILIVLEKES